MRRRRWGRGGGHGVRWKRRRKRMPHCSPALRQQHTDNAQTHLLEWLQQGKCRLGSVGRRTCSHSTRSSPAIHPLLQQLRQRKKEVRSLLSCVPRSLVRWLPRCPAAAGRCDANPIHPIGRRQLHRLRISPVCPLRTSQAGFQHLALSKSRCKK